MRIPLVSQALRRRTLGELQQLAGQALELELELELAEALAALIKKEL